MKKVILFAGTTEGRKLSELLCENRIIHELHIASDYGEFVLNKNSFANVIKKRLDVDEMEAEFDNDSIVIDATHPYATEVTKNIKTATKNSGAKYLRLLRNTNFNCQDNDMISFYESAAECSRALCNYKGNILLTTGSKDLTIYTKDESIKDRLYVRVLPGLESISLCNEAGITGGQIIALQGPFSKEMNEAMIKQYDIAHLVTKASGAVGGFDEKLKAAKDCNCHVHIIGAPKEEGLEFSEVIEKLKEAGFEIENQKNTHNITLAGIGMGDINDISQNLLNKINEADHILGAKRLIESFEAKKEKKDIYLAKDILDYIKKIDTPSNIVILFSGDCGFYSGMKSVEETLYEAIVDDEISAKVDVLPGISSISYLAAKLHESYQDASIISLHGRCDDYRRELLVSILENEKVYALTSSFADINTIGEVIDENNLAAGVIVAKNLSYDDENIAFLSAKECIAFEDSGLFTVLIMNYLPTTKRSLSYGMRDDAFIRGDVPMTKEEIRCIALSKLRLSENSTCYDIGCGTGSVAVEMARMSPTISVYGIEKKKEAIELMEANKRKYGLYNFSIVEGVAPEGIEDLPVPTHAFIGGSSGNLLDILKALYKKNNKMRIVISAITLDTIAQLTNILDEFNVTDKETIQILVTRTKQAGSHTLMQGENPIFICSFNFD